MVVEVSRHRHLRAFSVPNAAVDEVAVPRDEPQAGGPPLIPRVGRVEDVLAHAAPVRQVCVDLQRRQLGQRQQLGGGVPGEGCSFELGLGLGLGFGLGLRLWLRLGPGPWFGQRRGTASRAAAAGVSRARPARRGAPRPAAHAERRRVHCDLVRVRVGFGEG